MISRMAAGILAATLIACVPSTAAQNESANAADNQPGGSNWAGYVSLGGGLVPRYEGASTYQPLPYVEGRLNYDNYYARFEGGALRFNILDSESFHFGPYLGVRRGRGSVNGPVGLMHHLDDSETAGAFVEWEHVAKDPRSGEFITLSADDAVYGERRGGWTVTARADARRPLEFIDPGFIVSLELDATWASRPYMRTYFGVTPADAGASGLSVFNPGDGFKTVGVALSFDQYLSRHFDIGIRGHYGRLVGDAGDSPVTATPDQYFVGLVAGYVL